MTILPLSLVSCLALHQADPEESVIAGREALDGWLWSRYPWYDSHTDGMRRIDVSDSWFADWFEALLDSIGAFFRISWPSTFLEWLTWITIGGLLILLVYLLVRAYLNRSDRRLASAQADEVAEEEDETARIRSLPFPVRAARLNLLVEARRHYQQGDYGEAVKYLFSYQLLQLDKYQWIRLTRGKTNRQYLVEVGPESVIRRLLEETMVTFEDFFFGNLTIDRARFESCWSRLGQFETLVTENAV